MPRTLPDDLNEIPADERLALIGALWHSLAPAATALSERQLAELDRRRAAADVSRDGFRDWSDLKAELERPPG